MQSELGFIEWSEPPARVWAPGNPKYDLLANQLKENQDRWAKVYQTDNKKDAERARSTAGSACKTRGLKVRTSVARGKQAGTFTVYLRCVGLR